MAVFALTLRGLGVCLLVLTLSGCAAALSWDEGAGGRSAAAKKTARPDRARPISGRIPSHYRVRPGDTLYSIAWLHRLDYKDVAKWNNRDASYRIYPGELLALRAPKQSRQAASTTRQTANKGSQTANTSVKAPKKAVSRVVNPTAQARIKWRWPALGVIERPDRVADGRFKGLLIKGKSGQPFRAAADGEVVYVASGLRYYGVLIIVKHDNNYLSAYAHGDKFYVKEGERVKGGQTIGTMGTAAGIKGPVLRFDIRDGAQSVDPKKLLPTLKS